MAEEQPQLQINILNLATALTTAAMELQDGAAVLATVPRFSQSTGEAVESQKILINQQSILSSLAKIGEEKLEMKTRFAELSKAETELNGIMDKIKPLIDAAIPANLDD